MSPSVSPDRASARAIPTASSEVSANRRIANQALVRTSRDLSATLWPTDSLDALSSSSPFTSWMPSASASVGLSAVGKRVSTCHRAAVVRQRVLNGVDVGGRKRRIERDGAVECLEHARVGHAHRSAISIVMTCFTQGGPDLRVIAVPRRYPVERREQTTCVHPVAAIHVGKRHGGRQRVRDEEQRIARRQTVIECARPEAVAVTSESSPPHCQ